jgi:DNA repair protein RadA/Sms
MTKVKSVFICSNCGHNSPKWEGKCPSCGEWNTFLEEVVGKATTQQARQGWKSQNSPSLKTPIAKPLANVLTGDTIRLPSSDSELDRVLGGGIVPGSLVLLGGQPGIGKSTLLLQMVMALNERVLYVSGEESEEQIKLRADRFGKVGSEIFILTETNTERILNQALELNPRLIIIDSVQTVSSPHIESTPGSISQVRECTGEFQRFAKETNTPIFLVGHITKEGSLAGPKILEHIVDTVLQFEGDQHYTYRMLRTLKNRFGSTDELGLYEMQQGGLRAVSNPSEYLISQKDENLSGSAVASTVEGQRSILIETQALVTKSVYGMPQRTATGFDAKRLGMLLAVLEKRCGLFFSQHDVFLNIAGGIRVDDPGMDLSIAASLISSLHDIPISPKTAFAAEIGLSGEIRAVQRIENRIQEAERLGFKEIYLSKFNTKGLDFGKYGLRVQSIGRMEELVEMVFA